MKRAEDYLKENNRIESLKRSIELNDLHSIYSIMEDFVDAEIEAKNNESLHLVSNSVCTECGYPKFKKHHEDFERCNGCDWTSK